MARYALNKVLDYCFHPRRILKDGEWMLVPCGKCEGCLLHKANQWSQRLSFEIDNNPFSIFFTLTYNNKYLPTLVPIVGPDGFPFYFSDHKDNIRFNGSYDVSREDHIMIESKLYDIKISNDPRKYTVNYASKRDIQLWLKLLRKSIQENLDPRYECECFRYYVISEKGPTTHRWHFHGILFPRNPEVAEFLLHSAMYQNWQMCDQVLFYEYTKYCDSGTSNYVTNYVTSCSRLPSIYKDTAIKPIRLSSKSPAIGYSPFNPSEIFENVSIGVIEYNRRISRVDQSSTLVYPADYMARLFPKCYQFASLSYSRLLFVYGCLYRLARGREIEYMALYDRLREILHPSDWQAARACEKYCNLLGCTPFHYLFLLDMYYYKRAMSALEMWYKWQEVNYHSPLLILMSYVNLSDCFPDKISFRPFFEDFGIVYDDLTFDGLRKFICSNSLYDSYVSEVTHIFNNLEKMPKFNELNGTAPHIY